MSSAQFTLYSHDTGPNPWKVTILLNELGLKYETKYLDMQSQGDDGVKSPAHLRLNPNGRVPTLVDHSNNDYTIWESNAILLYLVERYDKSNKLSLPANDPEYPHLLQYLFFQASGQGPYFGQAAWFGHFHKETLETPVVRYRNEVIRLLGVLEDILKNREYLLGNKCTIADLSFVPWQCMLAFIMAPEVRGLKGLPQLDLAKDFPKVNAWQEKLTSRPAVKAALEEKQKVSARH